MDFDRLPTRPVVKSLASAQAEWDQWLAQNQIDFLRDSDGIDWKLIMKFEQLPSEIDRHRGKWVTTLQLGIDLPVAKLVETGTLDAESDARLLGLAGDGLVPLRMKKLQYEASGENEMRDILSRVLPELRENFRKTSLHHVKRDLLGRWIDGLSVFGERESRGVSRGGNLDELGDF
jgi:hypothetical protein